MSDAPPPPAAIPRAAGGAALHVSARPVGSACTVRCSYCAHAAPQDPSDPSPQHCMSDATLEALVRDTLATPDASTATFTWQGGEPTLRGLAFFRKAVELQQRHGEGRAIVNVLQTTGLQIDDEWAAFLAANGFRVGLALDGPPELHDAQRADAAGATCDRVLQALERLKDHGVPFQTRTLVTDLNAPHPQKVYRFLREAGARQMQFIPVVRRQPETAPRAQPQPRGVRPETRLARCSVGSVAYGRFLTGVFADWVRHDVGRVSVHLFESTLDGWSRGRASLCVFAETCGGNVVVDADGTVYSCDRYLDAAEPVGRLGEQPLAQLVAAPAQRAFGAAKRDTLPVQCRRCEVLAHCRGGCPSHRFVQAASGGPGLNYLCAGYRHFFRTVAPSMRAMALLVRQGRPVSDIMRGPGRR